MTTINNDFGGSVKLVNENTILYTGKNFGATWELKQNSFGKEWFIKDCCDSVSEYLKGYILDDIDEIFEFINEVESYIYITNK